MTTNKLRSENFLNVLDATATRLSAESDTPQLDAEVLVAHILKQPRTWLLAHDDTSLNQEQSETLESLLQRLERGEPLPYVIGHWEFFGLDFELTPDVLIPRPETELLVERAIPVVTIFKSTPLYRRYRNRFRLHRYFYCYSRSYRTHSRH